MPLMPAREPRSDERGCGCAGFLADVLPGKSLHKKRACLKKRRSFIFAVDHHRLSYTISQNSHPTMEPPASAWRNTLETSACNLKDH
jgi:hypothetical protein